MNVPHLYFRRMFYLYFGLISFVFSSSDFPVNADGSPEVASGDGRLFELEREVALERYWVALSARPVGSSEDFSYDWVVKYVISRCGTAGLEHPVSREFEVLQQLAGLGIVPEVLYASPVVPVASQAMLRRISGFEPCFFRKLDLGYIVFDRYGSTWDEYFLTLRLQRVALVDYFSRALKFGALLIDKHLRIMHERGIVHGSLSGGKIAFLNDDVDSSDERLVLLHFGESPRLGDSAVVALTSDDLRDFSIWRLGLKPASFRDDIWGVYILLVNTFAEQQLTPELDQFVRQAARTSQHNPRQVLNKIIDWKSGLKFQSKRSLVAPVCAFLNDKLRPLIARSAVNHSELVSVLYQAADLLLANELPKAPSAKMASVPLAISSQAEKITTVSSLTASLQAEKILPGTANSLPGPPGSNA